jgi:hypothetical protein
MSYLRSSFAYIGVQHILCCVVFLFCFSSSCVTCVMVSLDCTFLNATSVFSNVYL